jgi:RNA-directed DNA polymerase
VRDADAVFASLALRDGGRCYLCGQGIDSEDPFEIEHRVPRAAGGSDDLDNLGLAHRSCNRGKGTHPVGDGPR